MKHDVLTFIDSDTLREMLRGKELAPAIECILIAQSRKQPLTKKLEALTERADTYSGAEFQTGVYNLRDCEDFAGALRKYITAMYEALSLIHITDPAYVYQSYLEDVPPSHVFSSFDYAVSELKGQFWDDAEYWVTCRKLNDTEEADIQYTLNADFEITSIQLPEWDDWNIEDAFAEFPHQYEVGDVIEYGGHYYVIAKISHADHQTRWLKNADYGDMSLYCFGYYPDKMHSCGGSFGHYHVPILQTERINPNDLPFDMRPLKGFHLLLKGELPITDFLESYSNGSLDDLVCYLKKYKSEKKE